MFVRWLFYQWVCVHALFLSCMHYLCLLAQSLICTPVCLSVCAAVCVCLTVTSLWSNVDACLCSCLWCVGVVYCGRPYFPWTCHMLCLCFVGFYLFKQSGIGWPKGFYCTCTTDDLESSVSCWRRDHLSPIKLPGKLVPDDSCPHDFPSDPSSSLCSQAKFLSLISWSPYCSQSRWSIIGFVLSKAFGRAEPA